MSNVADPAPTPNAAYFGTLGGVFLSGAAQAARFFDGNTGRLAPCRYKVSGIAPTPVGGGRSAAPATTACPACERLAIYLPPPKFQ
jgi:hypothetical protein